MLVAACALFTPRALPGALATTGTFLDRSAPTDLRVATWNVYNDSVFADVDAGRNARFARVAAAVDADVWSFQEMYSHDAAQLKQLMDTVRPLDNGIGWHVYKPVLNSVTNEHAIVSKYPLSLGGANTSPGGYRPVAMALVDLPDAQFAHDLYLMNAHYRCCGDERNDPYRQRQSDAFVNWMRDARTPGGSIDLDTFTAMMVLGDFNLIASHQPLITLLDGDIQDNVTYGADSAPDWDGSANAVADALHNLTGSERYTWRDDTDIYDPGRLDYITYTDSVLALQKSFVLNTASMTDGDLSAAGLQPHDSPYDGSLGMYDHLPVVADFRAVPEPSSVVVVIAAIIPLLRRRRNS